MIHYFTILILSLLLISCADENSAKERNSTNFTPKSLPSTNLSTFDEATMLQNIYQNVLLADVKTLKTKMQTLVLSAKELNSSATSTTLEAAQQGWRDTVYTWKQIQGNWIEDEIVASDGIDEVLNLLDQSDFVNPSKKTPDFYANELINNPTQRITARYRTFFILENLLFSHDANSTFIDEFKDNSRRSELCVAVSRKLLEAINELELYWSDSGKRRFLENIDNESIDNILNKMIDNVYKSKETRLGDIAGLTQASHGEISPTKVESYTSKSALAHLKARTIGLQNLYLGSDALGLDDLLISKGLNKENNEIKDAITGTINALNNINSPLSTAIISEKEHVKSTFDAFNLLYNAVYLTLPAAMKVTPKIIEADGD
jgi:predicted lipoprotein